MIEAGENGHEVSGVEKPLLLRGEGPLVPERCAVRRRDSATTGACLRAPTQPAPEVFAAFVFDAVNVEADTC
ncbi:hypothetical protein D3C80_731270 [compost metagenome]